MQLRPHSTRHFSSPRAPLGLALLLLTCAGCAGPKEAPAGDDPVDGVRVENPIDAPVKWSEGMNRDQRTVGIVLLELDRSLRIWNDLVIGGKTARDAHSVKLIEESIAHDAAQHFESLVDQLAAGPPNNRRIAAAALGFSRVERALGPLLAALGDPDPEVIANALLSLGTLRASGTPLTSIAGLMEDHDDVNVRSNAARALRALVGQSSQEEERLAVRNAARIAIGDSEPGVRMSALLLLAELGDHDSLDRIALALSDEIPIVALAASRSVAHIGSTHSQSYGRAARALTAAMLRDRRDAVQASVRSDLQTLSGRNYGGDTDAWLQWANRLP